MSKSAQNQSIASAEASPLQLSQWTQLAVQHSSQPSDCWEGQCRQTVSKCYCFVDVQNVFLLKHVSPLTELYPPLAPPPCPRLPNAGLAGVAPAALSDGPSVTVLFCSRSYTSSLTHTTHTLPSPHCDWLGRVQHCCLFQPGLPMFLDMSATTDGNAWKIIALHWL